MAARVAGTLSAYISADRYDPSGTRTPCFLIHIPAECVGRRLRLLVDDSFDALWALRAALRGKPDREYIQSRLGGRIWNDQRRNRERVRMDGQVGIGLADAQCTDDTPGTSGCGVFGSTEPVDVAAVGGSCHWRPTRDDFPASCDLSLERNTVRSGDRPGWRRPNSQAVDGRLLFVGRCIT